MLTKKGKLFIVVAFCVAVFLTGQARLTLDDIVAPFRDDFREVLYLPRGNALKILAFGFNAPLADALFIKGLIYYAESFQTKLDKGAARFYTYELFDVITDLSPRFNRGYHVGSLFLTSSGDLKTNYDGIKLLEKGIAMTERAAAEGRPVTPDGRWLFHTLLANAYEVNIQGRLRQTGDLLGAAEARQRAGEEFAKAAESPNVPIFVVDAAVGYQAVLSGAAQVEISLQAMESILVNFLQQAQERGDKEVTEDLEGRIAQIQDRIAKITATREVERMLNLAGKQFLQQRQHPPTSVEDMVNEKIIRFVPTPPLSEEDEPDQWLVLPDGTFKSESLAQMDTQNQLDILRSAVSSYVRSVNTPPKHPEELVEQKLVKTLPVPPLQALGQIYDYDPAIGAFTSRMHMPGGLPPPPTDGE